MKRKSTLSQRSNRHDRSGFTGPILILAAAGIAVWPLLIKGASCGPDFSFHFVSWIDAQRSFLAGNLYPHWANGPNFGAGEPRFVFYPPLTWMAGAVLGLIFPWSAVPIILIYLLLAATGLANRALAQKMLGSGPATLAGCASIYIGNMLVDSCMRSDYAELAGGFWIPLLLLSQLNMKFTSDSPKRILAAAAPLALVFAGIWLTNGPLGIMASYLLAGIAVSSAALRKSWVPVIQAALAALIGGAVGSLYLIPAVWERNWASIGLALHEPAYMVENNWLFSHRNDPGWSRNAMMLDIHSWLAVLMFIACVLSLWVARKRCALKIEPAAWIPLALIPFMVFLMQFPVSEPMWRWFPVLRYLQFPWRWLILMNSPLAIFFAAAIWRGPVRHIALTAAACVLAFVIVTTAVWGICAQNCHDAIAAIPVAVRTAGIRGKPEYAPPGIGHALLEPDTIGNCVVRSLDSSPAKTVSGRLCDSTVSQLLNQPEHKVFVGSSDHPGFMILHLRSYPAWRVKANGHIIEPSREEGYGLMAVPISSGQTMVEVTWTTTIDVWTGRVLSALALALLALTRLVLVESRTTPPPKLNEREQAAFIEKERPSP